jgi:hypothetical protein
VTVENLTDGRPRDARRDRDFGAAGHPCSSLRWTRDVDQL